MYNSIVFLNVIWQINRQFTCIYIYCFKMCRKSLMGVKSWKNAQPQEKTAKKGSKGWNDLAHRSTPRPKPKSSKLTTKLEKVKPDESPDIIAAKRRKQQNKIQVGENRQVIRGGNQSKHLQNIIFEFFLSKLVKIRS